MQVCRLVHVLHDVLHCYLHSSIFLPFTVRPLMTDCEILPKIADSGVSVLEKKIEK